MNISVWGFAGDRWSPVFHLSYDIIKDIEDFFTQRGFLKVTCADRSIICEIRSFFGGRPMVARFFGFCQNAGMRHLRSPASVAAVGDGGSDGHRRRISFARSVLYDCRRCPHARGLPRAPTRGAKSVQTLRKNGSVCRIAPYIAGLSVIWGGMERTKSLFVVPKSRIFKECLHVLTGCAIIPLVGF